MLNKLTNEEIVTNLLVSNSIIKPQYETFTGKRKSLGDFLSKIQKKASYIEKKEASKYSFINKNLKWL